MKYFSIILVLFFTTSCMAQKSSEEMIINYKASTRGSQLTIKASSNLFEYIDNGVEKKITIPSNFWEELVLLVEDIELAAIESFIPPSEKRFFDGALQADLTITINEKSYSSQTFDHGNPPRELKKIIAKILDLIEK